MTRLIHIFAGFGLACLLALTAAFTLFLYAWHRDAKPAPRRRCSIAEREAEAIIFRRMR